jgi:hypothetical protein
MDGLSPLSDLMEPAIECDDVIRIWEDTKTIAAFGL